MQSATRPPIGQDSQLELVLQSTTTFGLGLRFRLTQAQHHHDHLTNAAFVRASYQPQFPARYLLL